MFSEFNEEKKKITMSTETSVGVSAVAVGSDGVVGFVVFVNQQVQVR